MVSIPLHGALSTSPSSKICGLLGGKEGIGFGDEEEEIRSNMTESK